MITKPLLFQGAAALKIALYDANGIELPAVKVGSVRNFEFQPTVSEYEHLETETGRGYTDFHMMHTPKLGISFEAESAVVEVLAMLAWGEKQELAAEPFTDREIVADGGFEVGKWYRVGRPGTTLTSLKTSADAVIAPEKYTLAYDGTVMFKDVAGVTPTIKATGSEGLITGFSMMSKRSNDVKLYLSGLNAADNDRKFAAVVPLVSLMPISGFKAIQLPGEVNNYTVQGKTMWNGLTSQSGLLGGLAEIFFQPDAV
jgi:hypothetical protein